MIKYAVYPGEVTSRVDGQLHYISASQLIKLYHVNPDQCVIVYPDRPDTIQGIDMSKVIALYPRYHGNYTL